MKSCTLMTGWQGLGNQLASWQGWIRVFTSFFGSPTSNTMWLALPHSLEAQGTAQCGTWDKSWTFTTADLPRNISQHDGATGTNACLLLHFSRDHQPLAYLDARTSLFHANGGPTSHLKSNFWILDDAIIYDYHDWWILRFHMIPLIKGFIVFSSSSSSIRFRFHMAQGHICQIGHSGHLGNPRTCLWRRAKLGDNCALKIFKGHLELTP